MRFITPVPAFFKAYIYIYIIIFYIHKYYIYIIYGKVFILSVFAFLPVLQCLCIHIVYIYIFYLLTLKFITIFKVPFSFLVLRGLGCLCSALQPPGHTETYAAVKLKGKPGNQ